MIERADFDQDGLVSEEEFYNLLTKKAYWLWIMALFCKITINIYIMYAKKMIKFIFKNI